MFTQSFDPTKNRSKPRFRKICSYCHKSLHPISKYSHKEREDDKKSGVFILNSPYRSSRSRSLQFYVINVNLCFLDIVVITRNSILIKHYKARDILKFATDEKTVHLPDKFLSKTIAMVLLIDQTLEIGSFLEFLFHHIHFHQDNVHDPRPHLKHL